MVFVAVVCGFIILLIAALYALAPQAFSSGTGASKATSLQKPSSVELQRAANRSFANDQLAEHTERQIMYVDDQICTAALTSSALEIVAFPIFDKRSTQIQDMITIDVSSIVIAELTTAKRLRHVTSVDREPVLIQHRKSPVVRGLVGTAMLGPIGMMLGAASGLNSSIELKHVDRKVRRVVEVEGPTTIVLATNNPTRPVIRLRAQGEQRTQEWYYRFRATIAG